MPFESILEKIFEDGFAIFNKARYKELDQIIIKNAELVNPEFKLPSGTVPSVHLINLEDIINYWQETNKNFDNRITRYEFKELGKKSIVRCYYDYLGLIIDSEFHFNNYGKIIKIVNHLVEE